MSAPLLEAKEIYKAFSSTAKVEVLSGVSLKIFPQKSLAIVGASGEGKTTLLYILGAIEKPDKGELIFDSKSYEETSLPQLRNQKIGFIFQSYNLLDDFTALENVLMPALIARQDTGLNSKYHTRALDLLKKVGLESRKDFKAKYLSGGEKQRVCIARALLNDPDIILADEPTGNLDHKNSEDIHHLLFSCVKDYQKSLILVTHDRQLAERCDETLLLQDGQLVSNSQ